MTLTPQLHQEPKPSFRLPPPPPPPSAAAKKLYSDASKSKKPINGSSIPCSNVTSAPSTFDQSARRVTREFPNLSDCHCCGVRINHTDPEDRLQTLDSVWRIVLLCKKCFKRVNSGQTCPYCYNDTANKDSDCFKCRRCERLVHKECVLRYENSPPWSYCSREQQGLESGFSVCVDCWVPRLIRKSIGVSRRKKIVKVALNTEKHGDVKSLENGAKCKNSRAKKKVFVAAKAKENGLMKAVVAKNALGLAKKAEMELVAKKGKMGEELPRSSSISSDDTDLNKVLNDAELAIQLHRAMNSSPRISKVVCPKKSSYAGASKTKVLESNNQSCELLDLGRKLCTDGGEKLKVYARSKSRVCFYPITSEDPPSARMNGCNSCADGGEKINVYVRSRLKRSYDPTSSEAPPSVRVNGCDSCGDGGEKLIVYVRSRLKGSYDPTSSEAPPSVRVNRSDSCADRGEKLKVYVRSKLKESFDLTSSEAPPSVRVNDYDSCDDSDEAEVITYKRTRLKRKMCQERLDLSDLIVKFENFGDACRMLSEPESSQQDKLHNNLHLHEASNLCPLNFDGDNTIKGENCNVQEDRYLLKYSKKQKCSEAGSINEADVHGDAFPHPTPNPGIPTCHSIESRTSSNASAFSCVVNIQTCACASDTTRRTLN